MSETKAQSGSKVLGGWDTSTRKYRVTANLGDKFPPRGSTCHLWAWGLTTYRVDETGRHLNQARLDELLASGALVELDRLGRDVPHKKAPVDAQAAE